MTEADKVKEELLRRLVTRLMRANSNLYEHGLGFSVSGGPSDEAIFSAKLASVYQMGSALPRMDGLHSLCRINEVPSVEEMVRAGAVSLSDVIRLRRSKAGRDFRRWFQTLWDHGHISDDKVMKEWNAMLVGLAKGPSVTHRLSVFGLTMGLGELVPFLGTVVSIVQEFVLPGLESKPYLLFDSLRKFRGDDTRHKE